MFVGAKRRKQSQEIFMAGGGKQPGAGRPPGAAAKKTRAIADQAAREGITPLEVMLALMRGAWNAAQALPPDDLRRLDILKEAHAAAKDAAPYMHPKLANLQHSGDADAPLAFVIYGEREAGTTDEWAQQHGAARP